MERACRYTESLYVRERAAQLRVAVFFFSSRRRHTRCSRDWSSDVCSSDLPLRVGGGRDGPLRGLPQDSIAAAARTARSLLQEVAAQHRDGLAAELDAITH